MRRCHPPAAPKAVINAAAFTAVDEAEKNEALATVINGTSPTLMAKAREKINIPLVHISTDYVFGDTLDRPWIFSDATAPQNAYGAKQTFRRKWYS